MPLNPTRPSAEATAGVPIVVARDGSAWQVATPRVRTAAKAEIPHLDDHVSKLHAVGNMTQNKLQDISAAAIAVGVYNIQVPYNTVTKGEPAARL